MMFAVGFLAGAVFVLVAVWCLVWHLANRLSGLTKQETALERRHWQFIGAVSAEMHRRGFYDPDCSAAVFDVALGSIPEEDVGQAAFDFVDWFAHLGPKPPWLVWVEKERTG